MNIVVICINVSFKFFSISHEPDHLFTAKCRATSKINEGFGPYLCCNKLAETKIDIYEFITIWTEHNILRFYVKVD
jgi:hypothetical protein